MPVSFLTLPPGTPVVDRFEALAERVAIAHEAESLDDLGVAIAGI